MRDCSSMLSARPMGLTALCRPWTWASRNGLSGEMILVGRAIGMGRKRGEVEKDEEGMRLVKTLGQRMAWLLKEIHG
jgi:hypothetical protein